MAWSKNGGAGRDLPDRVGSRRVARRKVLKVSAGGLIAGLVGPALLSHATGAAEKLSGKVLVVYFSWSGVTREVANEIHRRAGGDIAEIRPVTSYPTEYQATVDQAKREQEASFRPEITVTNDTIGAYDVVVLGYPNWWGTLPMALFSFLDAHDFGGKTVLPFCTHEGSRLGRSVADIHTLCPKATVSEGLALRGGKVANVATEAARNEIAMWLGNVGLTG